MQGARAKSILVTGVCDGRHFAQPAISVAGGGWLPNDEFWHSAPSQPGMNIETT